jgi:hypothetical protein
VSTFALIHGSSETSRDWHLVSCELREHGHDHVAVDPLQALRPLNQMASSAPDTNRDARALV